MKDNRFENYENEDEVSRDIALDVEAAFKNVPYPGNDNLIDSSGHWESPEVVEAFRGRHWKDISLDTLFTHRLSLSLFSPKAFLFYLPAYLVAALLHSGEVDTLRENVSFLLTPPDSAGPQMDWFPTRVSLFDIRQKEAVRRFMNFVLKQENSYPNPNRQRTLDFWSS
jgi:hypothetical protein